MTEIGEGQFDLETAVEPFDDGRFAVDVSDQWNIGDNPNGGYLTAIALQADSVLRAWAAPRPPCFTSLPLSPRPRSRNLSGVSP